MISLLLVETTKHETSRVAGALRKAFPDARLEIVDGPERARSRLLGQAVDLVISELELAGGNVLDLMAVLESVSPVPPLVLLSESGAEDLCLEALEIGACDLVIDSEIGIARLPPLVRRTLAERMRTREMEARSRDMDSFFTLTLDMLAVFDGDGGFRRTNPAFGLTLGYRTEDLRDKSLFDLVHEEDRDAVRRSWTRLFEERTNDRIEARFSRRDGSTARLDWTLAAMPEPGLVYGAAREVSTRALREHELLQGEAKLRTVFDGLPEAVFAATSDGIIEAFNAAAVVLFGYTQTEIYGVRLETLFCESGLDEITTLLEAVRKGRHSFDLTARTKDGERFGVRLLLKAEVLGSDDLLIGVVSPLESQQVAREVALSSYHRYQTHMRESLGAMASGIAHDFSNLLSPMIGYTEIAISDLPPGNPAGHSLRYVLEATSKARALIEKIYANSKRKPSLEPVALSGAIRASLELITDLAAGRMKVSHRIDSASDVATLAEEPLISLMLIELAKNSLEAVEVGNGQLEVSLETVHIRPEETAGFEHLREGDYAVVAVADNGPGMTPEQKGRALMPFFSTKGPPHVGMGLTVVGKIARKLGGEVTLASDPGEGLTVSLYLPVHTVPAPVSDDSRLRVLLVDDEREITTMLGGILRRHSCEVSVCNSGSDALALFRKEPERFDLVITDQRMPDMTGTRLAESITHLRPEKPVILISGYGGEELANDLAAVGIRRYLMKPVSTRVLMASIREVTGWREPDLPLT